MVGAEKLVNMTGRGMAKLQGLPDFPLAIIPGEGLLEGIRTDEDRRRLREGEIRRSHRLARRAAIIASREADDNPGEADR